MTTNGTEDRSFYPSHHALRTPEKVAFTMCATGETVTFAQLDARSNQGAHAFRQLGITAGEHITILMENRREFLEICFAADRAGLYYTTVSTHLTADDIRYIMVDSGSRAIVTSASYAALVTSVRKKLPPDMQYLVVGDSIDGFEDWESLSSGQPTLPIADERQGEDMLYSSGTTGRPKGVKWAQTGKPPGTRTMKVDLLSRLFGYSAETRYLNPAPLYHAAPLRHTMVTINMGGTVFIMDRFDAEASLRLIQDERITHCQWVPTMFVRMLRLPDDVRLSYDMSSLEMAVHAAAPCPVDIKERMIEWWGEILYEYYAGTENNGFCTIDTAEWLNHKGSVGRAMLGILKICDEAGEELPIGETGDVYFAEGHDFSYHNDPERTAASRNRHGWTTLGDIGRLDEEGYLYLTDRKSFMIISGGVNIYPQEIEDTILSHPAVADVAVIGVPNPDFGEEVKAVVQPLTMSAAGDALEEEILSLCRANLSKIKVPRSVDFQESLPRLPTGKLLKRLLRDRYWQQTN